MPSLRKRHRAIRRFERRLSAFLWEWHRCQPRNGPLTDSAPNALPLQRVRYRLYSLLCRYLEADRTWPDPRWPDDDPFIDWLDFDSISIDRGVLHFDGYFFWWYDSWCQPQRDKTTWYPDHVIAAARDYGGVPRETVRARVQMPSRKTKYLPYELVVGDGPRQLRFGRGRVELAHAAERAQPELVVFP